MEKLTVVGDPIDARNFLKSLENAKTFSPEELGTIKAIGGVRVVAVKTAAGEKLHFAMKVPDRHTMNAANDDLMKKRSVSARNEYLVRAVLINNIEAYNTNDLVYSAINQAVQQLTEEAEYDFLF